MKTHLNKFLILGSLFFVNSCAQNSVVDLDDEQIWRLGWSMIENSMDEKFDVAEMQFDSLLSLDKELDKRFLITGLEAKSEQSKGEEVEKILNVQSKDNIVILCKKKFAEGIKICANYNEEEVENKPLQLEIIKMYVNDQTVRGGVMNDVIEKYNLDSATITKEDAMTVDAENQKRIKEIFKEYGFPTQKLIGKDAMQGVFLIIQHADKDKEWQKSQFPNIEMAINNGDLEGEKYAYLYDRIQVNGGEKQRYGTQFAKIDLENENVIIKEVEDVENLDKRRQEMGMMPIGMYKRLIIKMRKK